MKKTVKFLVILAAIIMLIFPASIVYADSLDSITVDTNKSIVRPGEEVTLTINFGAVLGAYTIDIAYDNNIFEYVSASEGTPNDNSTRVRVVYHDISGGSGGSESLNVVFRAKSEITTSNPTEFSITAEGLSSPDAMTNYDDIVTPIVKNLTVEPEYKDYEFTLNYTGDIYAGEEKEMVLSYSSSMGRYYEKARLIAEATTPSGATVSLIGTDEYGGEEDIIQSGWGDPQGYEIGGKDVSQVLNIKALFTDAGDYTITLKLIDRDNSDSIIAEKEFTFNAIERSSQENTSETENSNNVTENEENATDNNITAESEKEEIVAETENTEVEEAENTNMENEVMPISLPKTGNNIFISVSILVIGLVSFAIYYNRKNHK